MYNPYKIGSRKTPGTIEQRCAIQTDAPSGHLEGEMCCAEDQKIQLQLQTDTKRQEDKKFKLSD